MSETVMVGKQIVLGVSGSIAAYKAADLASKLTQAGALVETILTPDARRFVGPVTFQSVTGQRAYTEDDLWGSQAHVLHIGLAQRADLLVIAPATAQTLARLAQGFADNLLSLTALAATCPLLVAPAMDRDMFAHPATQANLRLLKDRGVLVVGPEEGHLASGLVARGRMTEPQQLLGHVRYHLSRGGPLSQRHIIVTAGGTREPVDPVRVLTNRSSGRQGIALAQAALDAGAEVLLIATPVEVPIPVGVELTPVQTAAEMADAVQAACPESDALIMTAAVSDFRPSQVAEQKLKKEEGAPTLVLEPTPDILASIAQQRKETGCPRIVVGFAAETDNLIENAKAKLESKGMDLIVANDVTAADSGFSVDTNRVVLLDAWGESEPLPVLSKSEVARRVIERVTGLLSAKGEASRS